MQLRTKMMGTTERERERREEKRWRDQNGGSAPLWVCVCVWRQNRREGSGERDDMYACMMHSVCVCVCSAQRRGWKSQHETQKEEDDDDDDVWMRTRCSGVQIYSTVEPSSVDHPLWLRECRFCGERLGGESCGGRWGITVSKNGGGVRDWTTSVELSAEGSCLSICWSALECGSAGERGWNKRDWESGWLEGMKNVSSLSRALHICIQMQWIHYDVGLHHSWGRHERSCAERLNALPQEMICMLNAHQSMSNIFSGNIKWSDTIFR